MTRKEDDTQKTLDSEAFKTMHRQYRDRLVRSITGMVKDREVAEDIASLAFETAYANRDGFRGESAPTTWVYGIARNEARSSWRKQKEISLDAVPEAATSKLIEPDPFFDGLERRESCARVRSALQQIPILCREALVDHFVHGYSVKQVAKRRRVPVGTVLSRIFTGKQQLRRAWAAVT